MKKVRLIFTLMIMLTALFSVNAATIDEILESAKATSPSYQNIVLSYENGLLSVAQLEDKDKVSVSISASVNPLSELYSSEVTGTEALTLSGDKGIVVTPKLSVTLPNDGSTKITGGASVSTVYKDGSTKASGEVGVEHTFDFTGYKDDKAEDLEYTSTKLTTERTMKMSELNFEKSVLSMISSILNAESSIKNAEFNLKKQQKVYDKLVALKTYTEESSIYVSTVNTLTSLQSSLESAQKQYESLLEQYKVLTGLDWSGVDDLEVPELTLKTYENGNTEVLIQSLSVESSEDAYSRTLATLNPSSLSASLNASISSDKDISLSGGAQYSAKNWNVSVTPSLKISSSGSLTPTVTISGSWQNDTSDSDREINKALNNAKSAQNTYLEKLSSYQENITSYTLQILQWESKLSQGQSDLDYKKTLMENAEALYELGLNTEEDVESARLNYDVSQTSYNTTIIEGLSLERDLAIFAL